MKLNIEKISFIVIILNVILLNIFIGSNIKEPIWIIQTIITIYVTVYLIIKKVKKEKNVIIKNKIDIAVLVFICSTIIPLILKQYVSLEGTVNFVLKYFSVFAMYILVRNTVITEKRKNILINTFIISSIIPIIFGYDMFLEKNIFSKVYENLNLIQLDESYRMTSTFGYANTFAIYLSVMIFLAIAQILKIKEIKRKLGYYIYILLAFITMLLTQSKAVLAMDAAIVLIFILKGIKEKKIKKRYIIIGISAITIFFIYFFIAIKIDTPVVKDNLTESKLVIRGIEKNTNYDFAIDLTAQTEKEYDVYEIKIVEISRFLTKETLATWSFSSYDGIKTISFKTTDYADHIEIIVKNVLKQKITINGLKINGEKYVLQYKYIKDEIVRIFTTFNFKNSSVWQRGDYYKDALKIILHKSKIIGNGGNTWRSIYGQIQSYKYYAQECHSYILEIIMSYGIIGILSYIFILSITFMEAKKNWKNKETKWIFLCFLIIVLHSIMDFDLSFLIMEMLLVILIALINVQEPEFKEKDILQVIDVIAILVFMIIAIFNMRGLVAQLVEREDSKLSSNIAPWISRYQFNKIVYIYNNEINDEQELAYIKKYIEQEPYKHQNTLYEMYTEKVLEKPTQEEIEYIINIWKTYKISNIYEVDIILNRAEIMVNFAEKLEEIGYKSYSIETAKIVQNEYIENINRIVDYKRNGFTKTMISYKAKYYSESLEKAKKILEID